MAKPSEVLTLTNYKVGAVSPFGVNPVTKQIADNSIKTLPFLFFGSGESNALIKLSHIEFLKAFRGTFASISS